MKSRALLLIAALTATVVAVTPVAAAQTTQASQHGNASVVVLVDQSGSLGDKALAEEIRAVRALGHVPGIDVYVIGFASEGTERAWNLVCMPGDDLVECTDDLQRRSDAEGNDTDHAAALEGARYVFDTFVSGEGTRVVLLMTDGHYDPTGTERPTQADWDRLDVARDRLAALDVEVWPLGFGAADIDELNRLAVSSPSSCTDPSGQIVDDPAAVPGALSTIVADAQCLDGLDDDKYSVPENTSSLVLTYGEDELPGGGVLIKNEAGEEQAFACDFDEAASVWVCRIPTEELGGGEWLIAPPPQEFPIFPEPGQATNEPTTTTTTTVADTTTTTEAPAAEIVFPDVEDEAGFPLWIPVLLALLGVTGAALALYLLTRPKLPRGSSAPDLSW